MRVRDKRYVGGLLRLKDRINAFGWHDGCIFVRKDERRVLSSLVEALCDKSLIGVESAGSAGVPIRFRLAESIRMHASPKGRGPGAARALAAPDVRLVPRGRRRGARLLGNRPVRSLATPVEIAAGLMLAAAHLHFALAQHVAGLAAAREALAACRSLTDEVATGEATAFVGFALAQFGRTAEAQPYLLEALDVFVKRRQRQLTAHALLDRSILHTQEGDYPRAYGFYRRPHRVS